MCVDLFTYYLRETMERIIRSQLYLTWVPTRYTLEKLCSVHAPARSQWVPALIPGQSRDVPIVVLHGETSSPPFVLILSHANGENLETATHLGDAFRSYFHCDVIAYEYTGYGSEEVRGNIIPSEHALYADATAVAREAARLYPNTPIVSFGRSLGCALAVHVSATLGDACAGLILLSPFTSVFATQVSGMLLKALHPLDLFPLIDRISDESDAGVHAHVPLLVMHGDKDTVVSAGLGKKVYDAASRHLKNSVFVQIDGADHNSTIGPDFERTIEIMQKYFRNTKLLGNHVYD